MQSMKETAANVAASAKAGMGKTKAVLQEKGEKMSPHDPLQKEMATEKKEQRIAEAEWNKQEAREHNAAAKQSGGHGGYTTTGTGAYGSTGSGHGSGAGTYGSTGYGGREPHTYSAAGQPGFPMGGQQMSAMPGHGTGTPYGGMVDDGAVRTHPSGLAGETTGHNTSVEGTGLGPGGDMPRYGNRTGDAAPDYSRTGGIRDEYS